MEKKIDIIFGIIIVSISIGLFFYGYHLGLVKGRAEATENVAKHDTAYNKVVLDSIKYNITKKDSVVYNIKQEMKDEVTKSFELSDSDAVKLFKELCEQP
jgi:hypothetical protein